MFAGAPPPSSPDPLPTRPYSPDPLRSLVVVVVPSDPVAMQSPSPPSSPPAAAAEEDVVERPWPPMKMKLFPYAVYRVFGGMGRTGENLAVAFAVLGYLNAVVSVLSFYTGGRQACFWALVGRVLRFLCYVSTTFVMCMFIRYYMRVDGVYVEYFDPPPQQPTPAAVAVAAAEQLQLPPPPPEMDMC